MTSNGRRRWRRRARKWRRKERQYGTRVLRFPPGRCNNLGGYDRRHQHTAAGRYSADGNERKLAADTPPRAFSPRSLVGMSNSAKVRLARIDWLSLDAATQRLSFVDAWQRSCEETCAQYVHECRAWFRIGERLRPCPGCQTCGPLIEVEWLRCAGCGSDEIVYNTNPNGLPALGTCLMGSEITGEPGAEQCARCGSYDIVQDGTRRVPKYTVSLCTGGVLTARQAGRRRVDEEAG